MYKLTAYPLDKSSTLRYTPSTQGIVFKMKVDSAASREDGIRV